MTPDAASPPPAARSAGDSQPRPSIQLQWGIAAMHSIEDIIAGAQSAVAASLRSAYEAGRGTSDHRNARQVRRLLRGASSGPSRKRAAAEAVAGGGRQRTPPRRRSRRRREPAPEVAAEPAAEAAARRRRKRRRLAARRGRSPEISWLQRRAGALSARAACAPLRRIGAATSFARSRDRPPARRAAAGKSLVHIRRRLSRRSSPSAPPGRILAGRRLYRSGAVRARGRRALVRRAEAFGGPHIARLDDHRFHLGQ